MQPEKRHRKTDLDKVEVRLRAIAQEMDQTKTWSNAGLARYQELGAE